MLIELNDEHPSEDTDSIDQGSRTVEEDAKLFDGIVKIVEYPYFLIFSQH